MAGDDLNNYTVKEMLSLVVIPALDDLRRSQEKREEVVETRLSALESWRNKGVGAIALITAILIPVSIPVAIAIISTFHG